MFNIGGVGKESHPDLQIEHNSFIYFIKPSHQSL